MHGTYRTVLLRSKVAPSLSRSTVIHFYYEVDSCRPSEADAHKADQWFILTSCCDYHLICQFVRQSLGAAPHSSGELGELSQCLCHNDSTINIVPGVIAAIYVTRVALLYIVFIIPKFAVFSGAALNGLRRNLVHTQDIAGDTQSTNCNLDQCKNTKNNRNFQFFGRCFTVFYKILHS